MQHHRQVLTQLPSGHQPQLPGLMSNAPGAANMYKLLQQQQQQQQGKLNGEQGLPFSGGDLDMASMALAQQLQGLHQQQQRQHAQAQSNAAANNNVNHAALLALMQANPALAQSLGLGQNRGADASGMHGAGNPVAAAAAAAAASAAQQARAQQQALAAGLLRGNGAGMNNQQAKPGMGGNRMHGQQNTAGMPGTGAVQSATHFAALQRAAAAQVQQMLQQQQQQNAAAAAVSQQAQLMQAAAALAAQQQHQQNAQKQAQQMQAQQMLKAVLERSNHAAVQQQQQQQAAAMGQGAPINTAALMKQLQLHEALQKQDALARAAAAAAANQQAQNNLNPALAELLLRQQAAQQQDMAARASGAAAGANKGTGGLTQAQLQHLAGTPAGQALLRSVSNNMALDRMQQQQQQASAQASQANGMRQNMMSNSGSMNASAAAAAGTMDALLAAQSMMAGAPASKAGSSNGSVNSLNAHLPALAGGAEAPLGGVNGNKEQRRLALACVALQLARSGVSVEQAIQSGIMGGMSVMDVRFIVECYNAERERMVAASQGTSTAASVAANGMHTMSGAPTRPGTTSVHSSRTHSPATSVAGSHMSLFGMPHGNGHSHASGAPSMHQHLNGASNGVGTENGRAASHTNGFNSDHGSPRSRASGDNNTNSINGAAGLEALGTAPAHNFNAFNYGFFGGAGGSGGSKEIPDVPLGALGSGELLGELEPEGGDATTQRSSSAGDLGAGVTEEQLAWLQSTANAHRARWEGAVQEEDEGANGTSAWGNNDEIAARLANLDLGSGFM